MRYQSLGVRAYVTGRQLRSSAAEQGGARRSLHHGSDKIDSEVSLVRTLVMVTTRDTSTITRDEDYYSRRAHQEYVELIGTINLLIISVTWSGFLLGTPLCKFMCALCLLHHTQAVPHIPGAISTLHVADSGTYLCSTAILSNASLRSKKPPTVRWRREELREELRWRNKGEFIALCSLPDRK
ncbi:hypothetical protein CBL_09318 [Carabus blaptoides fortunei]